MTEVTVALRRIHDRIATAMADSGRESPVIRLVAVSKGHPPGAVAAAIAAGQHEFAENYLQEAVAKIQTLAGSPASWHYIGRIQSNKTRDIAACFDWVQTVDRERIAKRLSQHRATDRPALNVLLQLRLSDDPARPGVAAGELDALAATVAGLPGLELRGLMCMPPLGEDPTPHFEHTARCFESLRAAGHELDTLSMGTTGDFAEAIAAGSTLVRIGTAIFGPRPPN